MAETDNLDAAFDRLRRDVSRAAIGPAASDIAGRGRRRRRAQLAGVGVFVIIAAVCTAQLTRLGPSPRPPSTPEELNVTDLVYGVAARGDPARWEIQRVSPGPIVDGPRVPVCGSAAREPWKQDGPTAHARGYDLSFVPGPADADRARGEQVMALRNVQEARRAMTLILRYASGCGTAATLRRPAIGDEALSVSHQTRSSGGSGTESAVAVREGSVIAVYWDYHGAAEPALVTTAQHERDARTMAGRLCRLGYGC